MNKKEIFILSLFVGFFTGWMLVSLLTAFNWGKLIAWVICIGVCALILKPRK